MFLGILNVFKDCFSFTYTTLDKILIVGDSSVWDFLIVFFVAGVLLPLFASAFGGRAIAVSGSSTAGVIRNREKEKNKEQRQRKK